MSFLVQVVRWFLSAAHWHGSGGIPNRIEEHVVMSLAATGTAAAIALPIGLALGHFGRGGPLAINVSNVGRALPSFGIVIIAFQIFSLGDTPIIICLVALAIPPVVTNSYVALREVDPDIKEAARGMGYRGLAQLLRVELPLAVPLLMAGIRTSAVQVVATATLAALIGGGGFGRYVFDGLATRDYVTMFAGAALVAVLALATEVTLSGLERILVPRGIRLLRAPASRRAISFKTA